MTKKSFPSDKQDQYMIRFPDGMRDLIKSRAESSGRSMNAEIVAILETAIANPPELIADLKKLIESLDDEINIMEGDWRETIEQLKEANEINLVRKDLIDKGLEFQQRLMYHVLDYIDEIPTELSLWAFDMAQIAARERISSTTINNIKTPKTDVRQQIVAKREEFKARARKALKEHLAQMKLSGLGDGRSEDE